MKIKLSELYRLRNGKNAYDNQEKRIFELTLLLVKNSKLIESEIKDFEDARDLYIKSEEYRKFQQDRNEIIDRHKKRDEKGNFVMTKDPSGNAAHKLENIEELNGKLATLDDKNKEFLKKLEQHGKTINLKMEEEVDIPLKKIMKKEFVQVLNQQALVELAPLIGISLTKDLLGDKADSLNSTELERLMKFCNL